MHAMTVDLERWSDTEAVRHARLAPTLAPAEGTARLRADVERMVELLARHDVRATWFVVGQAARDDPAMVRTLAAAGHEVGSHGFSHTMAGELGPDAWRDELRRTKDLLEDILGSPVLAHRSPSWSTRRGTLWSLRTIAECGFTCDASLCPSGTYFWGVPGVPARPHRVRFADGLELREFPMATAIVPRGLPIAGGLFLRTLPASYIDASLRARERRGLPTTVYVHPWETDARGPRVPLPGAWRFVQYHGLDATAPRLAALMRRHRFAPLRELAATIFWEQTPVWCCPDDPPGRGPTGERNRATDRRR